MGGKTKTMFTRFVLGFTCFSMGTDDVYELFTWFSSSKYIQHGFVSRFFTRKTMFISWLLVFLWEKNNVD